MDVVEAALKFKRNLSVELSQQQLVDCTSPSYYMFNLDSFDYAQTKGLYTKKSYPYDTDHAVLVVGYGTSSDGIPYWIKRCSNRGFQ